MRRYDLRRAAQDDILDLLTYAGRFSDEAADRFIDRLTDVFERLSEFPALGRARPELGPDLRSFPVNRLRVTIFYAGVAE